jgi:outer membrane protein TolC
MKIGFIIFLSIFLIRQSTSYSQEKYLDYYIQQGLMNSPMLKDLDNQIRSNSIDSMLVKAIRLPQISFNGLMSYAPVINGYGYSEPITNGGNFITTVNLNQSLFNKKTTEARFNKIGIQSQSLESNARISENDLKKVITNQYLTTCSVGTEILYSNSIVKSLEDEDLILRQLTQAGIYSQNDYLNFRVELQGRRLLLKELQIQYRKELFTLNFLCGVNDTTTYDLVLPRLTVNSPVKPEISVYFIPYKLDSLRIQNERTLLDRNYKPVINWFADAGMMNNDPSIIYKNFGASIGLSFALPVYDGNQRKLNFEKLKYGEETRKIYEQFFQVQYNEQLRQLNDELDMTLDMMPQISQELELAETVIRHDRELLNNGSIPVTEFLLALRNYISIQQYKNQYEVKALQIINEINYWRQ